MTYSKVENFDSDSQGLARYFKAMSHPARIAILKYLAEQKMCFSGDITEKIPLSRTTVSQHLQELKSSGLIQGEISGTRVNYCLCPDSINKLKQAMDLFLDGIVLNDNSCNC